MELIDKKQVESLKRLGRRIGGDPARLRLTICVLLTGLGIFGVERPLGMRLARARTANVAGEKVSLTAKEFALLELLARRSGELVTRSDIIEHCYDFAAEAASNVIDVYIGYLRRKIERPDQPRLIHTRRGQGYVFGMSG